MLVLSGGEIVVGGNQRTFLSLNQGQRGPGLDIIILRVTIFDKLGWVDAAGIS